MRVMAAEGIARVFYCTLVGRRVVMLHQFIKKSEKTPLNELKIARNRMKEVKDAKTLKDFKARVLARPDVRREYEGLREEFEILDEILRARAEAGLTQAELANRIGTTQSAVARLETAMGKHSPSIGTLKRYASALGYRLQVRLVKERGLTALEQKTHSVPVDVDALLERARAIRHTPRGIRVTDRRLSSLKGRRKGMSKTKVREKQRSG